MSGFSIRHSVALLLGMSLTACTPAASPPASAGTATRSISVGVGQVDITPREAIRMAGYYGRDKPSQGVGMPLRATALAFGTDREGPAVLITADIIGISGEITEELARRLARAGVTREKLAVSVTHTHTGPELAGRRPIFFGMPPAHRAVVERYTRELVDNLERAALAALADRRPAHLAWGRGSVALANNRRVLKDGKWTAIGTNPEGPVDHQLPVLRIGNPDGTLRAVLFNYACHATTFRSDDYLIHPDWPGVAKQIVEARHPGSAALILIGAGGDQNPARRGGGIADVQANGQIVADEVDRVLRGPMRSINAPPQGRVRSVELRFQSAPNRAQLEEQAKVDDPYGLAARLTLAKLDRGETIPASASYPVQVWTFGNELVMVFLGGEVVVDYALRLQRELDPSRLWINAYTNDVPFYVPSRRMIAEGGYEVDRSMVLYGQPSPLADDTEERVIRAVRELVPGSFAASR